MENRVQVLEAEISSRKEETELIRMKIESLQTKINSILNYKNDSYTEYDTDSDTDSDNSCVSKTTFLIYEAKLVKKLEQVFETKIKTFKNDVKKEIKDQNCGNKIDSIMEMFEEYINKELKIRLRTRFNVCFTIINDEEGMFTDEDMDKVVKSLKNSFKYCFCYIKMNQVIINYLTN